MSSMHIGEVVTIQNKSCEDGAENGISCWVLPPCPVIFNVVYAVWGHNCIVCFCATIPHHWLGKGVDSTTSRQGVCCVISYGWRMWMKWSGWRRRKKKRDVAGYFLYVHEVSWNTCFSLQWRKLRTTDQLLVECQVVHIIDCHSNECIIHWNISTGNSVLGSKCGTSVDF